MKYIKTYEGLLKGLNVDQIISRLENKSDNEKIETLIKLNRFDLLPRNDNGDCVYVGILNCANNGLTSLPDNLKVDGDLNCSNNQLINLPENLIVTGNLYCGYNKLTTLPDNLKVGGVLYCFDNELISLPYNLVVNGRLDCSYNQLTSLPENLQVNGDLYCQKQYGILPNGNKFNKLELELPKSAKINGKFYN